MCGGRELHGTLQDAGDCGGWRQAVRCLGVPRFPMGPFCFSRQLFAHQCPGENCHSKGQLCLKCSASFLQAGTEVSKCSYSSCVQASNGTSTGHTFGFSISCHDGSHLRGRFEGAFDTSSAMAAGHITGDFSIIDGMLYHCSTRKSLHISGDVGRVAASCGPGRTRNEQVCSDVLSPGYLLPLCRGRGGKARRSRTFRQGNIA